MSWWVRQQAQVRRSSLPRFLAYGAHGGGSANLAAARNDDLVIRMDQISRERKAKRPAAVANTSLFKILAVVARRDCRDSPAIDRNIDRGRAVIIDPAGDPPAIDLIDVPLKRHGGYLPSSMSAGTRPPISRNG